MRGGSQSPPHDRRRILRGHREQPGKERRGRQTLLGETGDGPATNKFGLCGQRFQGRRLLQRVLTVQDPECAKLARLVGVIQQDFLKSRGRLRLGSSFLQKPPGMPDIPIVRLQLHFHQLVVGRFSEVHDAGLHLIRDDLIDAPVAPVSERRLLVAWDFVIPVAHKYTTVGAILQRQPTEPFVLARNEIDFPLAFETGSIALERLAANAVDVNIVEKEIVPPLCGKRVTEIDHRTTESSFLILTPSD